MHVLCVPDTDSGPKNIAFESDMELNSDEEGKNKCIMVETRQCGDLVIGRLLEIGRESRPF